MSSYTRVRPRRERGSTTNGSSDRYRHILERFLAWARAREDLRAVIVLGSRARGDRPADEFSDLDLALVSTDPGFYLRETWWLERLGTPLLTFVEGQAVGTGLERRVLFEGDLDVDFAVLRLEEVAGWGRGGMPPEIAAVFARGFRFAVDKDGLEGPMGLSSLDPPGAEPLPDRETFVSLCHDFLYHALWAAKKLRRGELWVARWCVDGYMKLQLLQVLQWHARIVDGHDTWHKGRFLESWADPRAVAELREAFARYDPEEVGLALRTTVEIFRRVAKEVATKLGHRYPEESDERVVALTLAHLGRMDPGRAKQPTRTSWNPPFTTSSE
jgi:aminoglycoside 6-adenylyltransferase